MMFLRKNKRRRPFPGTRARVICTRNATFDTRLVKKMSKSKKLTKSTFNKCVLLRISVRIRCPIPNCPKSHIRHKKTKQKKWIFDYCLLPIAYCLASYAYCLLFKETANSVMPGGGPTALCPDSVMPSQRYALLALCLAGVMPFCAREIYLNTLYLGRFCMTYDALRSFLHEKRRFC